MDKRIYEMREIAKQKGAPLLRDQSFELLVKTVKELQPKHILEIGVNTGLSGIAMLLSSPSAKLTGLEIDEDAKAVATSNYKTFGVMDRAKIFLGDASQILPVLTGEYDFVFLDGPKGHYYEYLPSILSVLAPHGVIFADNVLFRGYVNGKVKTPHRYNTTKRSMENYLNAVSNDENLNTIIYDIEDGVSITKRLK